MPAFIKPMLARLSTLPKDDSQWAYEVKWDGERAIARVQAGAVRLFSRNGNEITAAYPELSALGGALGRRDGILDGEIVAFDSEGRPSFQALQGRMHLRGESAVAGRARERPVTYMVFDLLWLDGESTMDLPYSERRERLGALALEDAHWHTPGSHTGSGEDFLKASKEQRLEGVVAKRLHSPYRPGARNGDWLKIKNSASQEFVIGGWTGGKGARASTIGALLLGVNEAGALRYAGRVGTGFDARELRRLSDLLTPLARPDSPFTGPRPAPGAHFVEPELVCEVEFTEWTRAGTLRHPSYKGLRDDKAALEVVRERVMPAGEIQPALASPAGSVAPDVRSLIEAGDRVPGGVEIEIEGRALKLTNLDKVMYPQTGFTKEDVIAYYASVAPALLVHLRDRPLTLKRYPNGVAEKYFYEKQAPSHRPDWVQTSAIYSRHSKREIAYTLCQDLATLVWLANLADIELHPSLSLAARPECPTTLAFDLDPGAPASVVQCCAVALELRELFDQLGLEAFAKSSGSKGLQVYVPLNVADATYAKTKPFAHAVADLFQKRQPELVVSAMTKAERTGKVLIDWSQNDEHKTTVSVYSLRARETPRVSTPLAWDEVKACSDTGDPALTEFDSAAVIARVAERGDLFAAVATLQQELPVLNV